MNVADLRRDYRIGTLERKDLDPDPIAQFEYWFEAASRCDEIAEANAMTLATAGRDGEVAARVVLLKSVDARGFRFFTNYESRKGRQIAENPRVSLSFYWAPLERQVIVLGRADLLSREESEAYFLSRPMESRLGAWVSPQSRSVESRESLERALDAVRRKYADGEVPIPPHWGGYLVKPSAIEFWQGRTSRLHDRFRYVREEQDSWRIERLAP